MGNMGSGTQTSATLHGIEGELLENWEIARSIYEGGQGTIYNIKERATGVDYIIKVARSDDESLSSEAKVYQMLDSAGNPSGFAKMKKYGRTNNRDYIILSKLGKSVFNLFCAVFPNRLPMDFALTFGISALRNLEQLHGLGFIHRDIKPDNFTIGPPGSQDESLLHLIDFGQAIKYIAKKGKRRFHIPYEFNECNYPGTLPFASHNANELCTVSRRDDLMSVVYCMVKLASRSLPWEGYCQERSEENINATIELKKNIKDEELLGGMPREVWLFYTYVKQLEYSERPNYSELEQLLKKAVQNIHTKGGSY